MRNIVTSIFAILFCLIANSSFAVKTTVNTLATLKTAFTAARGGDTIIVANGTYNWGQINLVNSNNNSTSNWIVLKAQSRLGVIFTGSTYLQFSGTKILVDGFKFANGNASTNPVVSFRSSTTALAYYSRISNILIDNYNTIDSLENEWTAFYGTNNRMDHCTFINKSNPRASVVVWYSTATFPDRSISTYHRIDSNYFSGRSYMGGNGGETIRIGVGNNSRTFGYNTIEYNLFENCTQAEPEIVSNKSYYNTYRYNTFKNCNGGLTLRMGKYCSVYGNFFINNDATKTDSYGVRIIDKGHKVFNNYFEGLLGSNGSLTTMRTPIVIFNGSFPVSDSLNPAVLDGAYLPADSAIVAFNTIVNCSGGPGIRIGHTDNGLALNQPVGLKIANNVIKMSVGQAAYNDTANHTLTYSAEGNLYSAPSGLGMTNTSGFTSATLTFGSRVNGILTAPSNVQDAAVNTSTYASLISNLDAQGQTRSSVFDIGCDEVNGSGSFLNFPLDSTLVGAGKPTQPIQAQTISFPTIPTKAVNAADFSSGATASSGMSVTLTSSNTNIATIVNGNIHLVGYGSCVITASQAGNAFYSAAQSVSRTLTVTGLSQTISFSAIPAKLVGDADFNPGATSTSGLTVIYSSSNASVATIINNQIHIVAAGYANITATQAGNSIYTSAAAVVQLLSVTTSYTYVPTTTTILNGTLNSGTNGNLSTNNSSYFVVNSTTRNTRVADWYGAVKITQLPSSISKLTINYDGKNSSSKTQILYLYNWSTLAWTSIDSRTVSSTDVSITNVQNTPANFISSTGEIRLRVYSSGGTSNYTSSGDWMQFVVQSNSAVRNADACNCLIDTLGTGTSRVATSKNNIEKVVLFPNPTKGGTYLQYQVNQTTPVNIGIYDANGKLVKMIIKDEFSFIGVQRISIPTETLSNGIYFIHLDTKETSTSVKFIISR